MMNFTDFLRLLAEDKELRRMIDTCLMTRECGEKLLTELDYQYHKFLFLRNIDETRRQIKEFPRNKVIQ